MTRFMTVTVKVVMYTISVLCAILAIRNILIDHALEAVVQTLACLLTWYQARTTKEDGTDN